MRNRVARLILGITIALVAGHGLAGAAPGEVIDGGVDLVATGKVVKKTSDSLVVRTTDHGHKITFAVDRGTVLPEDLAVGRHVRVVYHPTGSRGQAADKVTLTNPQRASR